MRRLFLPVSLEADRLLFAPAPKPIILLLPVLVLMGVGVLFLLPEAWRAQLQPFVLPVAAVALLMPALARLGAKKLLFTPSGAFWQGREAEAPFQPPRRVVYRETKGYPYVELRFTKHATWVLLLKGVEEPKGVASQVAAYLGRSLDEPAAK